LPDPPSGLTATLIIPEYGSTSYDQYVTINFIPGSGNGVPITGYEYSLDGTNYTSFTPSNFNNKSYTIAFPSVFTFYTIYVINTTSAGQSVPATTTITSPSVLTVIRVPPVNTVHGAPSITSASSTGGTITITFTAGITLYGYDSIDNYMYSTDGGATKRALSTPSTSSPLTISKLSSDGTTPLSVGTQYTIMINTVISFVSPSTIVKYAYWSAPAYITVSL
jgi:hypothetical protein